MNSAFATELYLKAVGLLYGKRMHGHDLSKLFKELPQDGVIAIEKTLASLLTQDRWSSKIETMDHFKAVLLKHRNAFQDWRYLHERKSADEFNFRQAIFTMQILHETGRVHPKMIIPK